MTDPDSANDFTAFGLDARLLEAIAGLGFETPTPIQNDAMPPMLQGRDLIGRARTGSGKTAAFGLPLLERLKEGGNHVRALVLAPTRELALQVTEAIRSYATKLPVRIVTVYGGASYGPQLKALARGVPIVVGTPGRVLDHLDRGTLDLSQLEVLVLDEADEMLRMGFLEDVERVLDASPTEKQIALFSASMPEPIRRVASKHLKEPLEIQVESHALTVEHIEQRAVRVPDRYKLEALVRILRVEPPGASLVFARTRASCAEIADTLAQRGVSVDALHGDLNQAARERVLGRLRSGRLDLVIATDVAARGIDVEHLARVINFDLPRDAETYVHRIGRTGRAGRKGVAISFVTPREQRNLGWLEKRLKVKIAPMAVPSDADIQRAQLRWLEKTVRAGQPNPAVRELLDRLTTEGDDTLAQTLLSLLAAAHDLPLEEDPETDPPAWSRPPQRKPRPSGGGVAGDEVELFFPVGKRRGIRPADLVGALANEAGVPGDVIGRITVVPFKSFVALPREIAEHVLEGFDALMLRGQPVRVSLARPRAATPPRERDDDAPSYRDKKKSFRKFGRKPGKPARPGTKPSGKPGKGKPGKPARFKAKRFKKKG